jgi:hypothetical protein
VQIVLQSPNCLLNASDVSTLLLQHVVNVAGGFAEGLHISL